MTFKTTQLRDAISFALAVGATTLVGTGAALAQQTTTENQQATTLDRIEVTGSRIKRAQVEGAVPVTVIDRETLEASGEVSVADYLRQTTFNSFGSFRPQSGSSAQSFAGISLRGLGSQRTLILVDGRRAPIAPNVGQGQDLNSIPLAAVERIEILTDGASAIYGSDAIGGVVNIITRKDFNGVELTLGKSFPIRPGGDTEEGSVIFGTSGDRGRLMGGISYESRDIVFQRDREYSRGGISTFSNNLFVALPAPGSLNGFRPGGFFRHPTNGSVLPGPNSCNAPGFSTTAPGPGRRCFYDFTALAADEAAISNRSLFLRGDYQISDDWLVYISSNVGRVRSFGRYAPVPSSPFPGGLPFLPVGSPNHPAVRFPGQGYDPSTPYFFRHRFAAAGPRDTSIDSTSYNFNLGFEGRINEVDVDFGIRRSDFQYFDLGRNYIVGGLAQTAISNGTYNPYDPFSNSRNVINGFTTTINRDARTKIEEVYGSATFDLFDMAGGTSVLAVGGEYREEFYQDIYDALSTSGQVVGSAGNSAAGDREVYAGFFELLLPVFSKFEVNLAGRYDRYSDYGNDFSPKISVRYQPFDALTFRASYGEGFRAPTLDILTQQPSFGAASISHPPTCLAFGQLPSCTTQVTTFSIANAGLTSEQSEQFSAGLVWDATDWLNLALDYYNIKIDGRIGFIGVGTIVGCLNGSISACPPGLSTFPANVIIPNASLGLGAAFGPQGEIITAQTGFSNLGTIETYGFDLSVRTNFNLGEWGRVRNQLQVTNPLSFKQNDANSVVGRPGVPRYRATLANTWELGDWSLAYNVHYIHSTFSTAGRRAVAGLNDYGYPSHLPSWTTHDIGLTYNAPWNGSITLGVQNVADKDPVQDPFDPTGRGFDFSLYDGYGRVPYIRYKQTF
ncbi:MAG: TonB-dependent receptor plug domain-containing protein [Luteimonas sp.]